MPKTTVIVEISAQHVPEEYNREFPTMTGYELVSLWTGDATGWMLYVPQPGAAWVDIEDYIAQMSIPAPIAGILRYASKCGARYVVLDPDCDVVDELPYYDW